MRQLLDLYARNRAAARPVALQREGADVTIEVVGTICTSDEDVLWWGGVSAQTFARELRGLSAGDVAHIRVNSPGGDVFGGVAMAQAMRECKAQIIVHIDGYAASAASFIVAAAPTSIISPGGMVMIHKAWTIGLGNSDDFMATAGLLEKIDGEIAAAYQAKAGGTAEEWLAAMAAETWYTGDEAVAAGLVTEVASIAPKEQAAFDLSVYAKAPKVAAPAEPTQPDGPTVDEIAASDAAAADIARRQRIARAFAPTAA